MRKKMKLKLSISIVLIALLACKKDTIQFTISGKVNDTSFNNGLAGASLSIYQVNVGTTKKNIIKTIQSDANGNYEFIIDREQAEKYYITCSKDNYFDTEKEIYFSELTTDKANTINLNIEAKAKIQWIVKNVGQTDSTDVFKIQKINGKTDCASCCPNTFYTYTGANVNDTLTCTTVGNTYLKFYKIDNQIPSSDLDTVYCTAFQTTTVTLNF